MLDNIFMQILNLSLSASFAIGFVLLARLALKRAPKLYSYLLWSVVLLRLLVPISIETEFSLIPIRTETFKSDMFYEQIPTVESGSRLVDAVINHLLPPVIDQSYSVNPIQVLFFVCELAWIVGMLVLAVISLVKLFMLLYRLRGTESVDGRVFRSERIDTPFVLGLLRPRIYLPEGLSQSETEFILEHEYTHIRRGDHFVRLIAFAALLLHWFNPLVWLMFALLVRDMEMSCDEAVLKKLGTGSDIRADYSRTLLSLTVGRTPYCPTPLAFGEGDTKIRIKNIVKYKPKRLAVMIALAAVVALISVILLCSASDFNNTTQLQYNPGNVTIELELPGAWMFGAGDSIPENGFDDMVTLTKDGEYAGYIGYLEVEFPEALKHFDSENADKAAVNEHLNAIANIYEPMIDEYEPKEDITYLPDIIYNNVELGFCFVIRFNSDYMTMRQREKVADNMRIIPNESLLTTAE